MGLRHGVAIARFDGSHKRLPEPEARHPCDENWPRKRHLKFQRFRELDPKRWPLGSTSKYESTEGSGRTCPCHGPCGCQAISAVTKRRSIGRNRRHASVYVRVWMFLRKIHCRESPSRWTPQHSVFGVAAVVDSVLRTFPEVLRAKERCPLLKMSVFPFWPWKVT